MRSSPSNTVSGRSSPLIPSQRAPNPRSPSRSSPCARSSFAMNPRFKLSPDKSVSAHSLIYTIHSSIAGVEPHQIFADGWAIGYDDRFPKHQRLQQAILFARFSEHDNLYAHPLVNCPLTSFLHAILTLNFRISFQSLTRLQRKSSTLTSPRDIGIPHKMHTTSLSKRHRPSLCQTSRFTNQIVKEYPLHSLLSISFLI